MKKLKEMIDILSEKISDAEKGMFSNDSQVIKTIQTLKEERQRLIDKMEK